MRQLTLISRRIALPSFVMTMPPRGSRSILSIDLGPSVVRMMSATALTLHRLVHNIDGGLAVHGDFGG